MASPNIPKSSLEAPKSRPRPSKIEARSLQNRAFGGPRCNFRQFRGPTASKRPPGSVLKGKNGQLASKLECENPSQSRLKLEKIDTKKQFIFSIDFGRVRTSFWKGFRKLFRTFFHRSAVRHAHIAVMLVIQQNHSIC